jgi:predicted aspartyl protease
MITLPLSSPALLLARFTGPNGLRRELRTLVRPGAPYCMIDREDAFRMGFLQAVMDSGPMHYELPPERIPWMATAAGMLEAPVFTLNEVSVGDLSAKKVDTLAYDLPDVTRIDAVLGETFLSNFTVVFDYRKRQLRLE